MSSDLRIPEIGETIRLVGRLVEIQDVAPPPPPKELDYIFVETTATVQIRANGIKITDECTLNDFYGSAVDSAIKDAEKLAAQFGPGVEIVVIRNERYYRARPTGRENFYAKGTVEFERLKHGCRRDLPDDTHEVVWSSHQQGANHG